MASNEERLKMFRKELRAPKCEYRLSPFCFAGITWPLMRRTCLQQVPTRQWDTSHLFCPTISGRKTMPASRSKPYGPLKFIADLILTGVTGGLWLVWVVIREIRYR